MRCATQPLEGAGHGCYFGYRFMSAPAPVDAPADDDRNPLQCLRGEGGFDERSSGQ